MKINWKVRLKNKSFWVMLIPAVLLLAEQVAEMFGVSLNIMGLQEQVLGLVGSVFAVLGLLGVVMDPTTKGLSDSERAMTYAKPN